MYIIYTYINIYTHIFGPPRMYLPSGCFPEIVNSEAAIHVFWLVVSAQSKRDGFLEPVSNYEWKASTYLKPQTSLEFATFVWDYPAQLLTIS